MSRVDHRPHSVDLGGDLARFCGRGCGLREAHTTNRTIALCNLTTELAKTRAGPANKVHYPFKPPSQHLRVLASSSELVS